MSKDRRKSSALHPADAKPATRRKPVVQSSAPPVKSKSKVSSRDLDEDDVELDEELEEYDEVEEEDEEEVAAPKAKSKSRSAAAAKSAAKPSKTKSTKAAKKSVDDEIDEDEEEDLEEDEEEEAEEEKPRRGWFSRWRKPAKPDPDEDEVEEVEASEDDEEEDEETESDDDSADAAPATPFFSRARLQSYSAFTISTIAHAAIVIGLALWVGPADIKLAVSEIISLPAEPRMDDEMLAIELEKRIEAVKEVSLNVVSSSPVEGVEASGGVSGGGGASGGGESGPKFESALADQLSTTPGVSGIGFPLDDAPSSMKLISDVPDGFLGDARSVVDDYNEAMDRLTQEIVWMLSKGKVLVVWCFDESESMKDDQQEIRDRIEKVYVELGLVKATNNDILNTAVTSFGQNFSIHTKKPTADLYEIRAAIDSVPNDPTGKEMLTMAVGQSIAKFRDYAKRTDRQMCLIVVTDESGDPDSNNRFLEDAIAEAKAAQCKIYCLGREAIFGYPYAHIRWIHPQLQTHHWLPIDRGPETAFVEQLQTDGFHRRYDAHSSGFGPYEQARMCKETGGIFFMLPSLESNLVRGEKRRYELEAMRSYIPDMRARIEVMYDRDRSSLRTMLWKVINDLNPYKPEIAKIIEMRMSFPLRNPELETSIRREQQKAILYLDYLARAQKEVEKLSYTREQEPLPRWQANYDLLYAQLIAYQARIYEYGAYLEYFLKNPKNPPISKPPNLTLSHWDVGTRKAIIAAEKSQPYIDKAKVLFEAVIKNHPGTPWAARAQIELNRGFGVELFPDYDGPRPPAFSGVPIPIPKL